ncbi:hypothetical protein GCM10027444_20670 [Actinopolyspora lacussalsi]
MMGREPVVVPLRTLSVVPLRQPGRNRSEAPATDRPDGFPVAVVLVMYCPDQYGCYRCRVR